MTKQRIYHCKYCNVAVKGHKICLSCNQRSTKPNQAKVKEVMHEFKHGTLHSGSGKKVTKRSQAVAIALNQARKITAKKKKEHK